MGKKVPDILLSGHHANVEKWRREQSIIRTLKNRPELFGGRCPFRKSEKFLDELLRQQETMKNRDQKIARYMRKPLAFWLAV